MAITTENDDMTILQPGPKGFVLGTVARYGSVTCWEVEHRPHGYAKQKPALTRNLKGAA